MSTEISAAIFDKIQHNISLEMGHWGTVLLVPKEQYIEGLPLKKAALFAFLKPRW